MSLFFILFDQYSVSARTPQDNRRFGFLRDSAFFYKVYYTKNIYFTSNSHLTLFNHWCKFTLCT